MSPEVRGFPVATRSGPAAELVHPARQEGRAAFFCHPDDRAIVLGSTQREATLRTDVIADAGYSLVRRRSGGGAVRVAPGHQVWLDLFVPVDDPLFERDVARASRFVGELWASALTTLAGQDLALVVHTGGVVASRWSSTWCFSGLGPGEVTRSGRKLVGLSQRRDRSGAWFFTMARYAVEPEFDASLVSGSDLERGQLCAELEQGGATLQWPPEAVERELARVLGER